MDYVIHWAGFFGGWLLVAGPVFQASLELQEEQLDREEFARAIDSVDPPKRISPWWWLLPPVGWILRQRTQRSFKDAVMKALSAEQTEKLLAFHNKGLGWMIVAGGAALIATKETWELVELYEAPVWVFWVGIVVMSLVSLGFTVYNQVKTFQMLHPDAPRPERGRRPNPS